MSEDGGTVPFPYVLDVSVLTAVARGDAEVAGLIMGQPVVIPVLAVAAASLDRRSGDADRALRGLRKLGNVTVAPLQGTTEAIRLAAVIARTALDPWDAHVAAVADAKVCPILTLDAAKWQEHARDLDEPLHFVEIAEPGED